MKNYKNSIQVMVFILYLLPALSFAGTTAGLWVGQIELNKVNEAASKIDATTPQDVKHPFDMRILLHVDTAGQVRMLREVTLVKKPSEKNEKGEEVTKGVLITDDTLLPQLEGVVRRDGKLVGIRMGASAFEFEADKNELPLTGSVGTGTTLTGTLTLAADHPSNPFRHKFHPDHKTGFAITRAISMTFDAMPEKPKPEDGISKLSGKYKEDITGLHKSGITMAGTFTLERVSTIDKLNDK